MEVLKVILAKGDGLDGDDGVDDDHDEANGSNYLWYDDADGSLHEYNSSNESKDEYFYDDTVFDPLPNLFVNFLDNIEDEDLGNEFMCLDIDALKKQDQDLMNKVNLGHFLCKQRDKKLYLQMKAVHDSITTNVHLRQPNLI